MQVGEFRILEYEIDGWRLDVPEEIKTAVYNESLLPYLSQVATDFRLQDFHEW